MESTNRQPKEEAIEDAAERICKFFEHLRLFDYIPPGESNLQIAILGAGLALEVKSLRDYFVGHGRNISNITAVDLSSDGKSFTEAIVEALAIPLDYRIADAGNPESLADEVYDLVIVRKPDVHVSELNWQRVIKNGFDHLREGGIFLVTTTEDRTLELASSELGQRGRIILNTKIPEQFREGVFFNDANVVIAQKGRV